LKTLQFDLLNKEINNQQKKAERKNGTAVNEGTCQNASDGRYLVVVRDLSERLKAEQQLRQRKPS
jgi:hypothetical protein